MPTALKRWPMTSVRPPRAILLEELSLSVFSECWRSRGDSTPLFWLIAKTNHHVLWGVSLDQCGYDFLNQILPLNDLCIFRLACRAQP